MFDVIQNIIRIKIYNNTKAGKGVNGVKQFHGLIFWMGKIEGGRRRDNKG